MEDQIEVTPVQVGDVVCIVTEHYEERHALVTAVHSSVCLNVVYVSLDESKRDPNGRQIERYSSLMHYNLTVGMTKRGRYWRNI